MPLHIRNGEAAALATLPVTDWPKFTDWLKTTVHNGSRLVALFPLPGSLLQAGQCGQASTEKDSVCLTAALANDSSGNITLLAAPVAGGFPSLTLELPCAHLFERILCEEDGLLPAGHPWLKPARFSRLDGPDVGVIDYFRVEGEDVHEVGVGPVHAGVIECGHFRFQCLGEIVMHLEISLGYHHRGVNTLLQNGPHKRTLPLTEVIAGDSTIAHTWACSTVIEALSHASVSPRGQIIRSLALELERLANHTGDLGALSGDAGFLPVQAYCGRLRGDWLNTTALLCGNRFGRGLVRPGGTLFNVDKELVQAIRQRIISTARDVDGAVNLLWHSPSFQARISDMGSVSAEDARSIGMVGPAARACALPVDCRTTHPLPGLPVPPALQLQERGDVYARTAIRQKEAQASVTYCLRLLDVFLKDDFDNALHEPEQGLAPCSIAVSLVEGFRGEVCHTAVTDANGSFARYSITDPSVHNWLGLALALRGQQISDFPLCNKSFNLSYCGHDL